MLKKSLLTRVEKFCADSSIFELNRSYPRLTRKVLKYCSVVKHVLDTALPMVRVTVYLDKSTQVRFKWCVKAKYKVTDYMLGVMDKVQEYPESYRNDRYVLWRFNFLCDLHRVNRMQEVLLDSYKFVIVKDLNTGEIYSNFLSIIPTRNIPLFFAAM